MNTYSLNNNSIQLFVAKSLFNHIKNNDELDNSLITTLYNRITLDKMRTEMVNAVDEVWIRERIFSGDVKSDLYKNYLLNLFQNFVTNHDKEYLQGLFEESKLISSVFLLTKTALTKDEIEFYYNWILENWSKFQEEELLYENPTLEYNIKFIDSFNKRLSTIDSENVNRYWLYVLSSIAIIGQNFTKNQIELISKKILSLPFGTNTQIETFYKTIILNKIKENEQ